MPNSTLWGQQFLALAFTSRPSLDHDHTCCKDYFDLDEWIDL